MLLDDPLEGENQNRQNFINHLVLSGNKLFGTSKQFRDHHSDGLCYFTIDIDLTPGASYGDMLPATYVSFQLTGSELIQRSFVSGLKRSITNDFVEFIVTGHSNGEKQIEYHRWSTTTENSGEVTRLYRFDHRNDDFFRESFFAGSGTDTILG